MTDIDLGRASWLFWNVDLIKYWSPGVGNEVRTKIIRFIVFTAVLKTHHWAEGLDTKWAHWLYLCRFLQHWFQWRLKQTWDYFSSWITLDHWSKQLKQNSWKQLLGNDLSSRSPRQMVQHGSIDDSAGNWESCPEIPIQEINKFYTSLQQINFFPRINRL